MAGAGGRRKVGAFPARFCAGAVAVIVCLGASFGTSSLAVANHHPSYSALQAEAGAWRVAVVDGESGVELWAAPVQTGDVVVYEYTHSADKTPVQSWLRVDTPTSGFILELERYLWYGAGLEFRADYGVVLEDGWVVVYADRPVPELVLRVAGTVEQRLIVGRRCTTLGDLATFGRRIMLEVRP